MNEIKDIVAGAWLIFRRSLCSINASRSMIFISGAFLLLMAGVIASVSAKGMWSMKNYRPRFTQGMPVQRTATVINGFGGVVGTNSEAIFVSCLVAGAVNACVKESGLSVFVRNIVNPLVFGLMLPIWVLSFSISGLGSEWENKTIFWLFSRPLPREGIYIGRWLASLPPVLAWCLGGYWVLCWLGGKPGLIAFDLFWFPVFLVVIAYSSVFFMLGACFSRPGLIAICYTLVVEAFLGSMPGSLKQFSVAFYGRSLVFNGCNELGLILENPNVYLPFSAGYARIVLVTISAVFLMAGVLIFREKELRLGR